MLIDFFPSVFGRKHVFEAPHNRDIGAMAMHRLLIFGNITPKSPILNVDMCREGEQKGTSQVLARIAPHHCSQTGGSVFILEEFQIPC